MVEEAQDVEGNRELKPRPTIINYSKISSAILSPRQIIIEADTYYLHSWCWITVKSYGAKSF